jgi:hypothetical protein
MTGKDQTGAKGDSPLSRHPNAPEVPGRPPRRNETPAERMDRNWTELLQELRVTQTGIQILSGFLLTLPFQSRFQDLSPVLVALYLTAVAFATLSTLLIVAPVTAHRLLFRRHAKDLLVNWADAFAKAGLVCLGITVTLVTALVFGFLLGLVAGLVAGVAGAVAFLVLWLVLPVRLRHSPENDARYV